jgi:hypothetical protein
LKSEFTATQVHLLFSKLRASGHARVVSLSSRAHNKHIGDSIDYQRLKSKTAATYDGMHAYGRSKLSNLLMAKVTDALLLY